LAIHDWIQWKGIKRDIEGSRKGRRGKRQGGGERTGRFAASHAKRIRNYGKDKEERREEGYGGLKESHLPQCKIT